jgi:hypothetical protein
MGARFTGNRENPLSADFELRDGRVGREFLAGLAQANDRDVPVPHLPRDLLSCRRESLHVLAMNGPKSLRDEQGERRGHRWTRTEPVMFVRAIVDSRSSSRRLDSNWLAVAVRTVIAGARAGTLAAK